MKVRVSLICMPVYVYKMNRDVNPGPAALFVNPFTAKPDYSRF